MALTNQSITQLQTIMQSIIFTALSVPEAQQDSFVRFSWPVENQPGWKRDEDVCFVQIEPQQSDVARQQNIDYSNGTQTWWYMHVIGVTFIFYGPNAYSNALALRYGLFSQSCQTTLAQNNMSLVTDVGSPVRAPELFNARWWERADLFAQFNEAVSAVETVEPLTTPNIQIIPD